jgi:hypothetical protein
MGRPTLPFFFYEKDSKVARILDFKIIAKLMENKAHLTKEGVEEIRRIKLGMNSQIK